MILAKYQGKNVEITGTVKYCPNRPALAKIRALTGEPFTQYTHGGFCATSITVVSADHLTDVKTVPDPAIEISWTLFDDQPTSDFDVENRTVDDFDLLINSL